MSLKPKLEAIIYAAETPITLDQIVQLVRDSLLADGASDDADVRSRVRAALDELFADYGVPDRGIEIRQVAGGYRMSTKPEQHRSEEHTSELQSRGHLVCRLLLE